MPFPKKPLLILALTLPNLHAQNLDNAAINRARSWLSSGDPSKVRAVVRSFQGEYQGGMNEYRSLLVESKRALEPRFDSAVDGQSTSLSPAEKQLNILMLQRLKVQSNVPSMPGDPFDSETFRQGMQALVKIDADCSALFLRNPEAARSLIKPVAPDFAESLELINSELTRFYPKTGLWITLRPIGSTFRGSTLQERKTRVDGYIKELRERPEALAEAREYFKDQPVSLASFFVQIQRHRQALGLRPIRPHATLTEITHLWADEEFALLEIPKETPPEAESELDEIARKKRYRNWIRHVVTFPMKSDETVSWDRIASEEHLIRALMDPQAIRVGISHFPTGIVLVLAEESAK